MPDPERLQKLAHLKDANGVFVFGPEVREECNACAHDSRGRYSGCPYCHGLGTRASQDMAVWVKTFCKTWLIEFRTVQVKTEQGERVEMVNCSLYTLPDRDWVAGADDLDPFEALILAIEKAVGKET